MIVIARYPYFPHLLAGAIQFFSWYSMNLGLGVFVSSLLKESVNTRMESACTLDNPGYLRRVGLYL